MNAHESSAWRILLEMGATPTQVGGCPALNLSSCAPRKAGDMATIIDAVVQVAGRSGTVARHQDRHGRLVLVRHDTTEPVAAETRKEERK